MRKAFPFIMPMFRSGLFILGGLFFAMVTKQSLGEAGKWWTFLCTVFNIITVLVLILICRYEETSYWDLIKHKKGQVSLKNVLLTIMLMLFFGVGGLYVSGLFIYGYIPTDLIQPIPIWVAIINIIIFPVTIVFAEMPLYFGYSFNRIKENTGNKILAIGYIIFFYALQHSFIPLLLDGQYILFRFLSFLPLMVVLGIIYNRKKDLVPMMIGHGVLDLAAGIQILIASISPAIYELMQ